MNFFIHLLKWGLGSSLILFVSAVDFGPLDPTDDFSFSLRSSPRGRSYHLISEQKVTEILKDRLDLFPKSEAPRLARHIIHLCNEHRLDPAFVLSLIETESSFKIRAKSWVGALGLMQVMVPTAIHVVDALGLKLSGYEDFGAEEFKKRFHQARKGQSNKLNQLFTNPYVNTAIGITYLAWLRDHYHGRTPYHVLAAYNVGPGRLDELLARKNFRPTETKKYFLSIRKRVPDFRFYKRQEIAQQSKRL